MCGIAGFVRAAPNSRSAVTSQHLHAMTDAVAHRGPDGSGRFEDTWVGLGHRRLSIIDIAAGTQPFHSQNGRYVLTYNGEIYNYRDIRDQLAREGVICRTQSDTEVLIEAYSLWGPDCLQKLNGMFAFAIWDRKDQSLFAVRDFFGQKPFLWGQNSEGDFFFGSEVSCLRRAPDIDFGLDPVALDQFTAYGYVPDPNSVYRGVKKLPAGHYMTVQPGQPPVITRYYHLPINTGQQPASLSWSDVQTAVQHHCVADVAVGCFLSSGLDSAGIAAALAAGEADTTYPAFTVGAGDSDTDERDTAAAVAKSLGLRHHQTEITPNLDGFIDRLWDIYGEPFADPAGFLTDILAAFARRHIKVGLGGDGADEVFGGYRRYRLHIAEERARRLIPVGLRGAIFKPLAKFYPKLDWAPQFLRAKSTFESMAGATANAYFNSVARVPDRDRITVYSVQMLKAIEGLHAGDLMADLIANCPSDDPLDQLRWMDFPTYLSGDILVKTDRATMAHGLEGRLPYLDPSLVNIGLSMQATDLIDRAAGKRALHQALRPHIPDQANRGGKRGFSAPVAEWIADYLQKQLGSNAPLFPALLDLGLVDADVLTARAREHIAGARDGEGLLWACMILERGVQRGLIEI